MRIKRLGVAGIVFVGTGYDSTGRALPVNSLDHAQDLLTDQFKAGLTEFARGGQGQWTDKLKKLWRESVRIYLVSAQNKNQLHQYADQIRQAYSQTAVVVFSGDELVEVSD